MGLGKLSSRSLAANRIRHETAQQAPLRNAIQSVLGRRLLCIALMIAGSQITFTGSQRAEPLFGVAIPITGNIWWQYLVDLKTIVRGSAAGF